MAVLPTSLFWERRDHPGSEHALIQQTGTGFLARGTALAVDPVAYTARYELRTGPDWVTTSLDVSSEGAGWRRTVRLEAGGDSWRVTTSEQGDLDAALAATGHAAAARAWPAPRTRTC